MNSGTSLTYCFCLYNGNKVEFNITIYTDYEIVVVIKLMIHRINVGHKVLNYSLLALKVKAVSLIYEKLADLYLIQI